PPPAAGTPIEPRPMAEKIEEPERERELDPLRVLGFQGTEGPDEEAEARRVGVALGGEPGHGFEDPRPLGETLEVLPDRPEGAPDVEVIEPQEATAVALEADGIAPGEQLEGGPEPRSDAPRPARDRGQPTQIPGVEGHEAIVLAQCVRPEDDPLGPEEGHGGQPSGRPLIPQLAEGPVVPPPVLPDPHAEIQVDGDAEERFELVPRRLADPPEDSPALADHDPLLGLALDEDVRAHVHGPIRPPIRELLHPHRGGVGHFVPGDEEELLADRLR